MKDIITKSCKIKNCEIGSGRPKICVPIVGKTREDIVSQAKKIAEVGKNKIDIVEFRGDFFKELGDEKKLKSLMVTLKDMLQEFVLLFTIRSASEGGEMLGFTTPSLEEINEFVIKEQLADMVDVELFSGEDIVKNTVALAKEHNVKIIMSNHDFHTTPSKEEIARRLILMQTLGADIAKIAVMPENREMVLDLLTATLEVSNKVAIPVVTMSMGSLGAISRVTGQIFGSAITFASLEKASAPGQIPVDDLQNLLQGVESYMI